MSSRFSKRFPRLILFVLLSTLLIGHFTSPLTAAPTATFAVDRTDDNAAATACTAAANDCSLRGAITAANSAGSADTITLPAGTYTLSIAGTLEDANATGDLDILDSVTIQGVSENTVIINGNGIDRVFDIVPFGSGTRNVSFIDVTIQNGTAPSAVGQGGGAIAFRTAAGQNGVANVTLEETRILNNSATSVNGGGIFMARGGTAPSNPILTINTSTIAGNSTANSGGGIACTSCTINITNSTISGNSANVNGAGGNLGGGGILILGNTASVSLTHTTVSGNQTNASGGGVQLAIATAAISLDFVTIANNRSDADNDGSGNGGGIFNNGGTFNIRNTIVGDNIDGSGTSNPDCAGTITSQNYNLIENTTGCTIGGTTTNNIIGAPGINALANNGGPTIPAPQTHSVQAASVVRNHIPSGTNGCVGGTTLDERGAIRAGGTATTGESGCEIGAYEFNSSPLAVMLALFEANRLPDGVAVTWETASEVDNIGFHLWRGENATEPTVRLNSELIPSQSPGGGQGAAYEWLDHTAQTGTSYFYWLDAVDVNGNPTRFGPVSVENSPTAITMTTFEVGQSIGLAWLPAMLIAGLVGVGILRRMTKGKAVTTTPGQN